MSDEQSTPAAPGAPAGRRRGATTALAVTVVLGTALLLWAADRLARWGAESVLARAVQEQTGVLETPTVQVRGGPVLLQALRGSYEDVRVQMDSVSSGPLRMRDYTAELSGVYLSFHDLLDSNTDQVFVEEAVEGARLTYGDLERYLGFAGRTLRAEPDGDGRVRLSGSVDLLGEVREVSAVAGIDAADGALLVRPVQVDSTEPLDGVTRVLMTQRFRFPIPLDPLLFARGTTEVVVEPSGLVVMSWSSGVVLGS